MMAFTKVIRERGLLLLLIFLLLWEEGARVVVWTGSVWILALDGMALTKVILLRGFEEGDDLGAREGFVFGGCCCCFICVPGRDC